MLFRSKRRTLIFLFLGGGAPTADVGEAIEAPEATEDDEFILVALRAVVMPQSLPWLSPISPSSSAPLLRRDIVAFLVRGIFLFSPEINQSPSAFAYPCQSRVLFGLYNDFTTAPSIPRQFSWQGDSQRSDRFEFNSQPGKKIGRAHV